VARSASTNFKLDIFSDLLLKHSVAIGEVKYNTIIIIKKYTMIALINVNLIPKQLLFIFV